MRFSAATQRMNRRTVLQKGTHDMKKLTSGFFAAALALALPLTANAQDAVNPEQDQDQCTATVAPIHAGEKVAATATFESPFGKIVKLEAPAESSLGLYTEKDGERTEIAHEGEKDAERAEMGAEAEVDARVEAAPLAEEKNANESKFWLVAENAPAGTYEVTLENEAGESCTTEITVEEKTETGLETDVDVSGEIDTETEGAEDENESGSDW